VADNVKAKPRKKKILIADDDAKIRALLREILSVHPYELFEAEDGKQALEIIHKEKIDLLITDRSMPMMDGLQLLQALREENLNIPSLLISGFGDEQLWAQAIGLGAEDYLLKPFSSESVLKVIERKLG
jgi:YesN/AraC family two-component response regulator